MSENNENTKERYWGSVRFFKHLILGTIALMILLPTCVCIFLVIHNYRLQDQNQQLEDQVHAVNLHFLNYERDMEEQISALEAQLPPLLIEEEAEAAAEGKTENWRLLLVNNTHPLPEDYKVTLSRIAGGQQVDARIKNDLEAMLSAMEEEGLQPFVCSAYRTLEKQKELFEEHIEKRMNGGWTYQKAFYDARHRLSLIGSSEHQTGLAVDIVGRSHQTLDDAQAQTPEAVWLAEHCHKYGFILRYPKDKEDITDINYQSWHFRYVGKESAAYIMANHLTLEEYLEIKNP